MQSLFILLQVAKEADIVASPVSPSQPAASTDPAQLPDSLKQQKSGYLQSWFPGWGGWYGGAAASSPASGWWPHEESLFSLY